MVDLLLIILAGFMLIVIGVVFAAVVILFAVAMAQVVIRLLELMWD